jgi:hypothetical protein
MTITVTAGRRVAMTRRSHLACPLSDVDGHRLMRQEALPDQTSVTAVAFAADPSAANP